MLVLSPHKQNPWCHEPKTCTSNNCGTSMWSNTIYYTAEVAGEQGFMRCRGRGVWKGTVLSVFGWEGGLRGTRVQENIQCTGNFLTCCHSIPLGCLCIITSFGVWAFGSAVIGAMAGRSRWVSDKWVRMIFRTYQICMTANVNSEFELWLHLLVTGQAQLSQQLLSQNLLGLTLRTYIPLCLVVLLPEQCCSIQPVVVSDTSKFWMMN